MTIKKTEAEKAMERWSSKVSTVQYQIDAMAKQAAELINAGQYQQAGEMYQQAGNSARKLGRLMSDKPATESKPAADKPASKAK
jgi:hypothetical protein